MSTRTSGVAVASLGSARVLWVDLPPEPASATRARELVRQQLAGSYSSEVIDAVELVATELVTNAILHAQTPMRLTIEARSHVVRVAVEDEAAARPERVHLSPDAVSGRGLALVEHLSSSWGVDTTAAGKAVWSEIAA